MYQFNFLKFHFKNQFRAQVETRSQTRFHENHTKLTSTDPRFHPCVKVLWKQFSVWQRWTAEISVFQWDCYSLSTQNTLIPFHLMFTKFLYSRLSFLKNVPFLAHMRKVVSLSSGTLYLTLDISSIISSAVFHLIRFVAEKGHPSSDYTRKGKRGVLKTHFRVIRKRNREKQRNQQ